MSRYISNLYATGIQLINKLEAFILISSVFVMAVNNVANVIGRFALNSSLFFSEELNSILIILITFAGTSYAARHGSHIRMTAIFDNVPHRLQKLLTILIMFSTGLCILAIAFFSVQYISWMAPKGKLLPALQIPVYITYIWIPVSLFLTAVEYLTTGVKNLLDSNIHLSSQVSGDGYNQSPEL